ncbi:acetyltransferase [Klebsiella phage KpLz-2_45]|uniref:acetyltransferase n=1 Tax=Klebsiella phage KpLz-2_45 TaxID=2698923 RepID=UPI001F13A1B8|nr:acetyltransferase [Klebsiella phage KpLz-2_45]UKS72067.1 hypothetical protein KpLz245_2010 [Klebsiella phage KpLz-2_45]
MEFVLLLGPEDPEAIKYEKELLDMFHVMDKNEATLWKSRSNLDILTNELKTERLVDRWTDQTNILLVVDKENVVGFVEYTHPIANGSINWMSISYLYVKRLYRRNGYGKALLNQVRMFAKHLAVDQVSLSVHLYNTTAQKFYESQGFLEQTKYLCAKP